MNFKILRIIIENINKEIIFISRLPRAIKSLIAILIDASCCILSTWLAYYLRLGVFVSFLKKLGIACLIYLYCFQFLYL